MMHIDHDRLSAWDKVIVDTSSLMESGVAFVTLLPTFRQAGVRLTIPATVRQELVKHLHGTDPGKRCKASHAGEVIRCYDEARLKVRPTPERHGVAAFNPLWFAPGEACR